jgi:putative ABC transport system substrate-binding protein
MRLLLLALLLYLPIATMAAGRIAIFDYDLRSPNAPGVAPYLEAQLKTWKPSLEIFRISAEGDRRRATEQLSQLDQQGWDLIVTITTDAFLIARHQLKNTPFVFTNINNPRAFGLNPRAEPGRRFTGASYYVPVKQQLELFLQIQSELSTLGFLFDPANRSMQAEAQEVRRACQELNIKFQYRTLSEGRPLGQLAQELTAEGVDALVATSSDRIYLQIGQIEQAISDHPLPIYSFNAKGVTLGALAAMASDHRAMIDQLVMPRIKALQQGQPIDRLAIGFLAKPQRYLNTEAIQRFGLQLPPPD